LTTQEAAWYRISFWSCLSVSLSLSDDNFRKLWRRKFILVHPVYLQEIRVKFVHEGHRVKVKVTGAKKVENPYCRNVKRRSAITAVL